MSPNLSDKHCTLFDFFPFNFSPSPNANVNLLLLKMLKEHKVSIPRQFTTPIYQETLPPPTWRKAWARGYRINSNFQEHLDVPITHPCIMSNLWSCWLNQLLYCMAIFRCSEVLHWQWRAWQYFNVYLLTSDRSWMLPHLHPAGWGRKISADEKLTQSSDTQMIFLIAVILNSCLPCFS